VPSPEIIDPETIKQRWQWKLSIQFPALFTKETDRVQLLARLDSALQQIAESDVRAEHAIHEMILNEVFKDEPWRIHYYDGHTTALAVARPFNERVKIEEPPFITPSLHTQSLSAHDVADKTLLFKAPADAYRIGMYEQLFPQAYIHYLHLTRGFAQTVNGLMDGWLSQTGFFSHDLERVAANLRIQGYSDKVPNGHKWWKFDLPPNWRNFIEANLIDVCLNQWISPHKLILETNLPCLRIHFEDFISNPSKITKIILEYLGLKNMETPTNLPLVMTIEKPTSYRWRKRAGNMLALGERREVREIMELLGYTMDPKIWL